MALIALLSGGLDSTVALCLALRENPAESGLALTFDYGQRSAPAELEASKAIALELGLDHREITLPFLQEIAKGPMVDESQDLPRPGAKGIASGAESAKQSAAAVWIPNRNGLFLAIAASYADARGGGRIVVGFNREEAETFPDNSEAFLDDTNKALERSTANQVEVISPTKALDKAEIVRAGFECGAPLSRIHSCHEGSTRPCGTCEPCERLRRALVESNRLADFLRLRQWESYPGS